VRATPRAARNAANARLGRNVRAKVTRLAGVSVAFVRLIGISLSKRRGRG
jgi:hypothetical protein